MFTPTYTSKARLSLACPGPLSLQNPFPPFPCVSTQNRNLIAISIAYRAKRQCLWCPWDNYCRTTLETAGDSPLRHLINPLRSDQTFSCAATAYWRSANPALHQAPLLAPLERNYPATVKALLGN